MNYPFNANYTVSNSSISTTANLFSGMLTNNATSGTQKLLSLTNTGTGTTADGIYVDNTGTGTTAIEIAGTWTNGILTNNNSINAGSGSISTSGSVNATTVNATTLNATTLALSGLTADSFVYSGAAGAISATVAPTNGQLLMGQQVQRQWLLRSPTARTSPSRMRLGQSPWRPWQTPRLPRA